MKGDNSVTRCGFVAIVGRPNVGKSTLLNTLVGKKVSITSFRPQTTRLQILGIKTQGNVQTVFVDTPGIHLGNKKALNRYMNKTARQALIDVNAVIFVVEALKWTAEDQVVCQLLQSASCPIYIALNKIDLISDKEKLLPFMQQLQAKLPQAEIIPVSATKAMQIQVLDEAVKNCLPESVFYFPQDEFTNHSKYFYVSEIIREKLMRLLGKELPYASCVQVESIEDKDKIIHISALIWVEREGQKRIVIGEKGSKLKEIGQQARLDMERYFGKKVFLQLWVKVKEGWSEDPKTLEGLGFTE